ncbi:hypothetical protein M433DRAFT_159258, partial [Acidomyces richmondensis BFW]
IVWTCSVTNSIAKRVDLPGLAPIWESGRSFLCSASLDILLATTASRTFASVLSRAIGLYAPAFL